MLTPQEFCWVGNFSSGFISPVKHRCFTPGFLPLQILQDKQHDINEVDHHDVLGWVVKVLRIRLCKTIE